MAAVTVSCTALGHIHHAVAVEDHNIAIHGNLIVLRDDQADALALGALGQLGEIRRSNTGVQAVHTLHILDGQRRDGGDDFLGNMDGAMLQRLGDIFLLSLIGGTSVSFVVAYLILYFITKPEKRNHFPLPVPRNSATSPR